MNRPPLTLVAILTLFQICISRLCIAQGYQDEKLTWLDAAGHPTREKKAVVLEQMVRLDDTLWEVNLYRVGGPRFRSMQFNDVKGTEANGHYISYNEQGRQDTLGVYSKGLRSGTWIILTSGGRTASEQLYKEGTLVWTKDSLQIRHEGDSLLALHKKDSGSAITKTFVKVEIESEFPGGSAGWLRYLNKNMRYPDYALKNKIQGRVLLGFIVDTLGHIPTSSVLISHSVEFSIDQEALRIIFSSPDWTPAVQNGRKVKSYKRQPIIFKFG